MVWPLEAESLNAMYLDPLAHDIVRCLQWLASRWWHLFLLGAALLLRSLPLYTCTYIYIHAICIQEYIYIYVCMYTRVHICFFIYTFHLFTLLSFLFFSVLVCYSSYFCSCKNYTYHGYCYLVIVLLLVIILMMVVTIDFCIVYSTICSF